MSRRAAPAWEPWQREYEFGALYLFPPPPLCAAVDELRWRHDPRSAAICGAHVSLSRPLPGPLSAAHVRELRAAIGSFARFEVEYGPLRGFLPRPGVALAIGPEASLRGLQDAIHATSPFAEAGLTRPAWPLHMTIAEFVSVERSTELLGILDDAIAPGRFSCEEVVVSAPDDDFHFDVALRIPLGAGR